MIVFFCVYVCTDPAFWYEDYPIALVGRRQSPINIRTNTCVRNNKELKLSPELQLDYPQLFHDLKLRNPKDDTFFGWRVDIPYNCGDKTCKILLAFCFDEFLVNCFCQLFRLNRRSVESQVQVDPVPRPLGKELFMWLGTCDRWQALC